MKRTRFLPVFLSLGVLTLTLSAAPSLHAQDAAAADTL